MSERVYVPGLRDLTSFLEREGHEFGKVHCGGIVALLDVAEAARALADAPDENRAAAFEALDDALARLDFGEPS